MVEWGWAGLLEGSSLGCLCFSLGGGIPKTLCGQPRNPTQNGSIGVSTPIPQPFFRTCICCFALRLLMVFGSLNMGCFQGPLRGPGSSLEGPGACIVRVMSLRVVNLQEASLSKSQVSDVDGPFWSRESVTPFVLNATPHICI